MRRPSDLPLSGRRIELRIVARRFWCDAVLCGRRIFCEQFDKYVLARCGRRTQRLETNALALWREMKAKGSPGQSGVISQWAQRRRLAEKVNQSGLARTPSARVIARLMITARDDLAKAEAILVAAFEVNVPELVVALTAIGDFQSMIRSKNARKLDEWLDAAKNSLVGSFAGGVARDLAAVRNGSSPNGQMGGLKARSRG